jgi:5-methylcytosine-specific restriction endonuclease McrA
MTTNSIGMMSDDDLLGATMTVAGDERRMTAELLALLAELDARRLYLGEGCSSLFAYCTQVLKFSEHAAYHRIETARAARYFPLILELVADGSVTTTTVALLRPHLTLENHARLLAAARHKSKREVEQQIACLAPKTGVHSLVRRLPAPIVGASLPPASPPPAPVTSSMVAPPPMPASTIPVPRPKVEPLASDRYLLRVTLSTEGHANLRRAQDLTRHAVPNGDPAVVIERALALFVGHLERQKIAATSRPHRSTMRVTTSGSRHLPAAVRREVWSRDGGRCAFVGPQGRCTETGRLEFHHVVPFARGGPATPTNISLRCRAHNGYESEQCFGRSASRAAAHSH